MTETTNAYEKENMDLYQRSLGNRDLEFKGIVCPKTWGEHTPCALCDACRKVLFDKTIDKRDSMRQYVSSVNQKNRYYSNVIIPTAPSEILIFEYGDKIMKQLIKGQVDPLSEWKDFFDPVNGRNLWLSKIQGATREQVDYMVEPRMNTSRLPVMSILQEIIDSNSPHYLTEIVANLASGRAKSVYQSKLVPPSGKLEVRFLPSWLGPGVAKFWQRVIYHYNISQEEFDACQEGRYNIVTRETYPKKGGAAPSANPVPKQGIPKGTDAKVDPYEAWLKMGAGAPIPSGGEGTIPVEVNDTNIVGLDYDEEPICFGNFDASNKECIGPCTEAGWREPCEASYQEKLKRRAAAKRVAR